MFKRIVSVIEVLALVAALVFVVALFTNDSGSSTPASPGAALFSDSCARCHGSEGQGGSAPQLAGKVEKDFPNAADQIAFVKQGRDGMPGFGNQLSAAQIEQVVNYTRTL